MELLRRANDSLISERRASRRLIFAFAAIASIGAFTAIFVHRARVRRESTTLLSPARAPFHEVADVDHSRVRTVQNGATTILALDDGEAAFHVEHLTPMQRFVVQLPDGEVEVRGTRFYVDVVHGETERVAVSEGVVALRVRGMAERLVTAGERWTRDAAPVVATTTIATSEPATVLATTTSMPPARDERPTPAPRAITPQLPAITPRNASPSTTTAATTSSAPVATPTAGVAFADAVRAFDQGRYADADAAFAAFERDHSTDARCEDAAFLRCMCALRSGDEARASGLAKRYLALHPSGLRRSEAEALAKRAPPP
jgi:hypothetical protein